MAYKVFDKCYLEADDEVSRTCIWCDTECERTEVLDNGEEIELWCYCQKCDTECFKQIKKRKMIHELKTHPQFFSMVFAGTKNFEVRKDDRGFKLGDELLLKEFVPKGFYEDGLNDDKYTGRILHRRIDYILKGGQFGIEEGFVVLSISRV